MSSLVSKVSMQNMFLQAAFQVKHDEMQNANNRLATFTHWSGHQRPFDMAEAGLFYLNVADDVQCPFCEVVIHDWLCADVPIVEHQRLNPCCSFILGADVGNIPLYDDPIRGRYPILRSYDVCGNWDIEGNKLRERKSFYSRFIELFKKSFKLINI